VDHQQDDRSADEKAQRDAALDEALEETFPTSDAVQLSAHPEGEAITPPSSRTWFVTGSARGLGRDVVHAALRAGDQVVATARDPSALDELVQEYPDALLALELDVTDEEMAIDAVRQAVVAFGSIDVVVNNAGYADMDSVEDMPSEVFRQQIETNFFGVVNVTRAVLPIMREQGSGHILQIASVGARIAVAGLSAYQSAKFAVRGFSLVLAQEVYPLGIKVTVVQPGGIRTDWAGSSMRSPEPSPPYEETVGQRIAMLRANSGSEKSDPARIAEILVDIAASDDAPLELLIGSDAFEYAQKATEAVAASDLKWENLSKSADYAA